ncbi:Hypothetical predicted protein, partial [Paramuricea clavata]
ETLARDYSLIFGENPEQDEMCDGLINREYEQGEQPDLPYYEEELSALVQTTQEPRRCFCESFLRSCKANVGLVMKAVSIIGSLIVGLVYLDLNTTNACIQWVHDKFVVPSHVRILQMIAWVLIEITAVLWMVSDNRFFVVGFQGVQKELSVVLVYLSVGDSIHCLCLCDYSI